LPRKTINTVFLKPSVCFTPLSSLGSDGILNVLPFMSAVAIRGVARPLAVAQIVVVGGRDPEGERAIQRTSFDKLRAV